MAEVGNARFAHVSSGESACYRAVFGMWQFAPQLLAMLWLMPYQGAYHKALVRP
jgi:hypothetical protein